MNEIEGRADPGDGGDHVDPADDLADPFGNLRVDHAGPWAMERALTLAHRAEKWTRFSLTRPSGPALDDALVGKRLRMNPESATHFWVRCSAVVSFAKGPASRFFNRKSVPILRPFRCRCQPDGLTPGRQPERFQGLFPIRPYSLCEVSWDACPPTFWIQQYVTSQAGHNSAGQPLPQLRLDADAEQSAGLRQRLAPRARPVREQRPHTTGRTPVRRRHQRARPPSAGPNNT